MNPIQLSLMDVTQHAAIIRGQKQAALAATVRETRTVKKVKALLPVIEINYFDLAQPVHEHRCKGCGADYFNRLNEGMQGYCSGTCQQFFWDWIGNKVTAHTPRLMKYKWVMNTGAMQ